MNSIKRNGNYNKVKDDHDNINGITSSPSIFLLNDNGNVDNSFVSPDKKETLEKGKNNLTINKKKKQYEIPKTPELSYIVPTIKSPLNSCSTSSNDFNDDNREKNAVGQDGWNVKTAKNNKILERPRRNLEPLCDVIGESRKRSREGSISFPATKENQEGAISEKMNFVVNETKTSETTKDETNHKELLKSNKASLLLNGTKGLMKMKKRSINKSSSYRGVSKCIKDGRWQTRIRVGSIVRYLGRFHTEEIAARCYDAAFVAFFGIDTAIEVGLNYPDSVVVFDPNNKVVTDKSNYYVAQKFISLEALQVSFGIISKIKGDVQAHKSSENNDAKQFKKKKSNGNSNINNQVNKNRKKRKLNTETDESIDQTIIISKPKEYLQDEKDLDRITNEIVDDEVLPTFKNDQILEYVEKYTHLEAQPNDILGAYNLLLMLSSRVNQSY